MQKNNRQSAPSATFQRISTMFIWVTLGVFVATMNISKIAGDDDVFWHLATGRWIVQHQTVPSTDVFSFPIQSQQWIPFEWGWDVLTYLLYSITNSYVPLYVLVICVWLGICSLLMSTMRRMNISTPTIVLTLLFVLFTSYDRMTLRPHVISLLGLSAVVFCYMKFRYGNVRTFSTLFWLPAIFLIWANMHPGVLSGVFLLLLIAFSETGLTFLKRLSSSLPPLDRTVLLKVIGVFLGSILIMLINPHGINTFFYVYSHAQMKLLTVIIEWMPPFSGASENTTLTLYKVTLGLSLLSLLLLVKKRNVLLAILIIGFGLYSLRAVRFIADFAIISSFSISLGLDYLIHRVKTIAAFLRSKLTAVLFIVLIAWMSYSIVDGSLYTWLNVYRHFGVGIDERFFPKKLIDFLNSHNIRGRPFNQLEVGGYLMWERPEEQNFIDSRNLSDSLGKEYYWVLELHPGFEERLSTHEVDYIVLYLFELTRDPKSMGRTPIPYLTYRHDIWKLVYWDDLSFVYLKDTPKFRPIVAEYEYKVLNPFLFSYNKRMFDSLRTIYPEDFQRELQRKFREEPNGFITNLFVSYSQNVLRKQ